MLTFFDLDLERFNYQTDFETSTVQIRLGSGVFLYQVGRFHIFTEDHIQKSELERGLQNWNDLSPFISIWKFSDSRLFAFDISL